MTRPPPVHVVADLPATQAELLAVVHGLARRVALARRETGYSAQLEALERERSVAEIVATSHGVPAVWVAQARDTGTSEKDWRPDTVLRQLPRLASARRSAQRVSTDTARLADMAATAAVRQHFLAESGYPGRPDPVADEQLHRNMNALRTRITATAGAIGMKPAQFRRATTITDAELAQRVQALSVQNPDDVEVRWRDYTDLTSQPASVAPWPTSGAPPTRPVDGPSPWRLTPAPSCTVPRKPWRCFRRPRALLLARRSSTLLSRHCPSPSCTRKPRV